MTSRNEGISTVLFCVSLTDYNAAVDEEEEKTSVQEARDIFSSVINSVWFTETCILLFLYIRDSFDQKILSDPLTSYFEDYQGGVDDRAEPLRFINNKFLSLDRQQDRQIFVPSTCATDTRNIYAVFKTCIQSILSKNLDRLSVVYNMISLKN